MRTNGGSRSVAARETQKHQGPSSLSHSCRATAEGCLLAASGPRLVLTLLAQGQVRVNSIKI